MPAISCEVAYPRVEISRRSRSWWSWLKARPPACIHLDRRDAAWLATLLPDTLYLRGKSSLTRTPGRPEISLCRECLVDTIQDELAAYPGRTLAFEPDPELFTQYFFVGAPDFEGAGLKPDVAQALTHRLERNDRTCEACDRPATWLWFSREQVPSLDEVDRIREESAEAFCPKHGAQKLCRALEAIPMASLYYVNLPYGESGAYLWI
ncbi:MAG TPA: hypothetical protein VLY23_04745 [Candidatus Acidoferrum sp.]|nr:hypothetical protein [Candidatus Acidoferrum sp.]